MTNEDSVGGMATTCTGAIVEFLDGAGVDYELVEHEPVMSAAAEARVAHAPPDQVAKTVVLHDGSAYVIAAIPASERLDLHKLLGATRELRLANEDDIARDFPSLEVGAVPPFGPMVPAAEVIDRARIELERQTTKLFMNKPLVSRVLQARCYLAPCARGTIRIGVCAGVRGSYGPRSGRGYGHQKPVGGVELAMLRTYVLRSAKWLRPPLNPPRLSRVQRLISATSHRSSERSSTALPSR